MLVSLDFWCQGRWVTVGTNRTDGDGRVNEWGSQIAASSRYHLVFSTGEYYARRDMVALYPEVIITAQVVGAVGHLHIPLLLSPFSYTTYLGS